MNRDHRAQLLVCHERIAVGGQGPMENPADWARAAKQYCDLGGDMLAPGFKRLQRIARQAIAEG